jgi:type III secretion protein Q
VTTPERSSDYRPLRDSLPAVPPDLLPLIARLHRRRLPVPISTAAGERLAKLSAPKTPHQALTSLPLSIGSARACLHLCAQTASLIGIDGWQQVPPTWRGLHVERALLGSLVQLEELLHRPIRFSIDGSDATDSSRRLRLGFVLESAADGPRGWLDLDDEAAHLLAGLLDQRPSAPQRLSDVPLLTVIECGWQSLTSGDLRTLRPGDVVMLDRPADTYRLRVADALETSCVPDGPAAVRLVAPLSSFRLMEPNPMEASLDPTPASASPSDALDRLPVRLVCEVGRLELPLGDVRELGEGSVLQLGCDLTEPVQITVNGRYIGRGELVTLGTGLGVRLTSFAADE